MSKHKQDPLLEALQAGRSYTWTVPEGGDLASMREAIKHGQTLTMSPVANLSEIQVGDLVLVKWQKGTIFHLVRDIQGDQFLIVNSLGKVNGWVRGKDILGRVTHVLDPESHSSVPVMLEELEAAYQKIIRLEQPAKDDAQRLITIVDDLRWYASRIGAERWNRMPRSNKWSFEQNLWRLTKQAKKASAPVPQSMSYLIDCGKACVGLSSEIFAVFEYDERD